MSIGTAVSAAIRARAGRLLATAGFTNPGLEGAQRFDSYGDAFTIGGMLDLQGAALSGSYFVASNATVGTEIATTANQTAYDQDKPVLLLQNPGSTKVVLPDLISLKLETVLASATRLFATIACYDGLAYVSGGTELVANCTHIGSDQTALGKCYFGAVTSSDVAKLHMLTAMVVDVVPVIDSQIVIRFGAPSGASATYGATTGVERVIQAPPICLGPNTTMELYLYGDSGLQDERRHLEQYLRG